MKATMHYFPVVLFMLYKVALWKKFLTSSIYVKATVYYSPTVIFSLF